MPEQHPQDNPDVEPRPEDGLMGLHFAPSPRLADNAVLTEPAVPEPDPAIRRGVRAREVCTFTDGSSRDYDYLTRLARELEATAGWRPCVKFHRDRASGKIDGITVCVEVVAA